MIGILQLQRLDRALDELQPTLEKETRHLSHALPEQGRYTCRVERQKLIEDVALGEILLEMRRQSAGERPVDANGAVQQGSDTRSPVEA